MRKLYCPECGEEIIITREVPVHSFSIEENELVCLDNCGPMDTSPELRFHCSNDMEHNIEPQPDSEITPSDFNDWMEEVEEFFMKNVQPHLY